MINLIPMAGLGSRFSKEGYLLPKPLISVSGKPMIAKVIEDLPKADKWIFVIRKEHLEYGLDKIINKYVKNAIIIPIDYTTEGQACTCMLAWEHINPEQELLIAACDNGYLYDKHKFERLKAENDFSCIAWTFTKRETLLRNPNAWGWYGVDKDNTTINKISVKKPISDNPYLDHAVTATFYFKKAKYFKEAYELMVKENHRINNEFYVDSIPSFLMKLGKKSAIFDVDMYIGWGKPDDLHEYEFMEYLVKNDIQIGNKDDEKHKLISLWRRYFSENERH